MSNITILIPTSPIPSHPSTAIIDETIANVRQYTNARIIIMCDGVHESLTHRKKDYEAYISNLLDNQDQYGDCKIVVFDEHKHQCKMTRFVLDYIVTTPLILFCEHDTSPIGEIPFMDLCYLVSSSDLINNLRFNIFHKIPDEHQYLMVDKEPQLYFQRVVDGFPCAPIMCVRTIQWSQRPHIAKAKWYLDILNEYFKPDAKTMIEDVMHSVVQVKYDELKKDIFGLAIYTPDGNQLRSYHSDGRGNDEKIIEG
jgi:hypothetical protein